jgi:transposase
MNWIIRARSTGNKHLNKLANTIESHAEGILNWYDFPVNSGRIEGINNKIKVMKRKAYGYNDLNFFKLLIMAILSSRDRIIFRLKT